MAGLEDSGETIEALKAKYFEKQKGIFSRKWHFIPTVNRKPQSISDWHESKLDIICFLFILGIVVFNIFLVLFLPAEYAYAWGEPLLPYLRAISIFHVPPKVLNNSPLGGYAEFMTEWLSASWVFISLCFIFNFICRYKKIYKYHKVVVFYFKVADESDIKRYKKIKILILIMGGVLFFWGYLLGDAVYKNYGNSDPKWLEGLARAVNSRWELAIPLQMYFFIAHGLIWMSFVFIYSAHLFYWIMKYLVRPFHPDLFADIDQNIRPEDREALRARMMAESAGAERGAPKP